jgi:small subunit ribosomal protein S11
MSEVVRQKTKAKRRNIGLGIINIYVTFNNTIVTVTDAQGNPISTSSAGANKFKGPKKSTPYAAQITVDEASRKAMECGVKTVSVKIKGTGPQRESALRAVFNHNFIVTSISDVSAVAHNGVRPRKRRRV